MSFVKLFEGRKECTSNFDCAACLADPSAECAAKFAYVRKVVYNGENVLENDARAKATA